LPAEREGHPITFNWAMLLFAFVLTLWWTNAALYRPPMDFSRYPVAAMKAVQAKGLLGERLLSPDLWGDYIVLSYGPKQQVFMDDRYDVYSVSVAADLHALMTGHGDWRGLAQKYRIRLVVWPTADRSIDALLKVPGWKKIFQDQLAVVLSDHQSPSRPVNPNPVHGLIAHTRSK
jgi:hypothetical protein